MKTKLLRKLRKKFDWKYRFTGPDKDLLFYLYDKKTCSIFTNNWSDRIIRRDFEFLLEKYGNLTLLARYYRKEAKRTFNRL
jgi:hypothetical protein